MSEEKNDNSSKIQESTESEDDSCTISTSENNKVNFSAIPTSRECIVDSTSIKEESKIDCFSTPVKEESTEKVSANSKSGDSPTVSSTDVHSSTIQTSKNNTQKSVTVPTSVDNTEDSFTMSESAESSSIEASSSEASSADVGSADASSEESIINHYQIEESIHQMIKHIEKEIEAEEHGTLKENHFQNIEMKIKTSRVIVAIEQNIQKLEIAFCLPWIFVENMHDISVLCGDTNMSKMMNEYCKIRDVDDMDVCRFQPTVFNCINDAYEAGFSKFVDLHRKKIPEAEARFLSTLVQFKCMAEWRIGMSAIKAMNKEKTLHKMWTSNEKTKSKISELEMQNENYRKKLQEMADEKNNVIATHNRTIYDLEMRNTNDINAEIFKSDKAMRQVCRISEEKQKALTAELQQIKETYEKLVQSNLFVEKTLRDKKSKTRQKLQAVLTKYDTGVGERFAELLRIRNELENETLLYENKVKEFQLQEIEYNQIMFDKAEVDAKIREEKLLLFMMNRSARIIQRAYKKMMKKKKKGKKGKKGKKAKNSGKK